MSDTSNGLFTPVMSSNDLTKWSFAFRSAMSEVRTATPVKVVAVDGGGLGPVGRVDVQPLVQQTDSQGNIVSLPVLYGLPYLRWQGGSSAVILDPIVGDIGLVCLCDRDISAVVSTASIAPPGSNRRFSLADGFYVGASLNAEPAQYIQFASNAIDIVSPNAINATVNGNVTLAMSTSQIQLMAGGCGITINSSGVSFTGAVTGNSTATFSGEGEFNGVHVSGHHHPGVQTGSGNTGTATG